MGAFSGIGGGGGGGKGTVTTPLGTLDATLAANLPASPNEGDTYLISVTGTFEGSADILGSPVTFTANKDLIQWNGNLGVSGLWRKLDASDLSASDIKVLYEANADTNAFTDAEKAQVEANKPENTAGDGLAENNGKLDVQVDDSTVELAITGVNAPEFTDNTGTPLWSDQLDSETGGTVDTGSADDIDFNTGQVLGNDCETTFTTPIPLQAGDKIYLTSTDIGEFGITGDLPLIGGGGRVETFDYIGQFGSIHLWEAEMGRYDIVSPSGYTAIDVKGPGTVGSNAFINFAIGESAVIKSIQNKDGGITEAKLASALLEKIERDEWKEDPDNAGQSLYSYSANQIVEYNGLLYRNYSGGVIAAGSNAPDLDGGNWENYTAAVASMLDMFEVVGGSEIRVKSGNETKEFIIGSGVTVATADGDDVTGDFENSGANIEYASGAWGNRPTIGGDLATAANTSLVAGTLASGVAGWLFDDNTPIGRLQFGTTTGSIRTDLTASYAVNRLNISWWGTSNRPSTVELWGSNSATTGYVLLTSFNPTSDAGGTFITYDFSNSTAYRYYEIRHSGGLAAYEEAELRIKTIPTTNNTTDAIPDFDGTLTLVGNSLEVLDENGNPYATSGRVNVAVSTDGGSNYGSLVDWATFVTQGNTYSSMTSSNFRVRMQPVGEYKVSAITIESSNAKCTLYPSARLTTENDGVVGFDTDEAVQKTDTATTGMDFVLDEDDMTSDSDTKLATQQSIKAYVDSEINSALASEMTFKGDYDASTNTPDLDTSPSGVKKGDMYVATAAGTFFTTDLQVGDTIIAKVDDADAENEWVVVQANLTAATIKTQYESNADTNAFTDADESKLDGIEALADVTDTDNVTAAGALMDSELTDLAGVKALDTSTLQVKPSEGAFVDGDKTKLDAVDLPTEYDATAAASLTLDYDNGNSQTVTALSANTAINLPTNMTEGKEIHIKFKDLNGYSVSAGTNASFGNVVPSYTTGELLVSGFYTDGTLELTFRAQ